MYSNDKDSNFNVKDRIVEVATKLFEEKGFHATTIQEICDHAEISKGGLFHYFKQKEDMLVIIHDKFINYVLENAEKAIESYDNPTDVLKILICDLVYCVGNYRPYVSVFFQERRFLSEEKFVEIRKKRDRYEQIFENVLRAGMSSKEFRADLNYKIVLKGIFGMCDWLYQWYNPNGALSPEEIGEIFWDLLFEGLKERSIKTSNS